MSQIVFKCPRCGTVQYVKGDGPCWKCHTMVVFPKDGIIQIYRMASCMGIFGRSMEIYINGILFGYVEFNESIRIPVPYGHHHVMRKDGGMSLRGEAVLVAVSELAMSL